MQLVERSGLDQGGGLIPFPLEDELQVVPNYFCGRVGEDLGVVLGGNLEASDEQKQCGKPEKWIHVMGSGGE